ncbi:coenzyme F420-0:L-glutamate ligase [Methanobrevibacter filiformis]|nr:coenzyme F420-0:L-glutamate ligase [Methanobrevibacter filiformis]
MNKNNANSKTKNIFIDNYRIIPIETGYIEPNENLDKILNPATEVIEENDYLVIAETPIAISQGRVVDESQYRPGFLAKFLAIIWSKYLWGYVFGPILKIKKRTIDNLRKLPPEASAHKEVVLKLYGLKHGLKPASEAGIDLSNAPGTYVSLLPENPSKIAKEIAIKIKKEKGIDVKVLIVDTDATYKLRNTYFTGLPEALAPIKLNGGVFAYILGQLSENIGPTPIGASSDIPIVTALEIANLSEKYQKTLENNMETFYSMKKILGSGESNNETITIEMLNSIIHTPAVIIRNK